MTTALGSVVVGCASGPGAASAVRDAGRDVETREDAASDVTTRADRAVPDAQPPVLTALEVVGASAGLVPAFAPSIHDYYVRCAPGANPLSVSMTASSGAESSLQKPTTSPAAREQTVAVSVQANQAIVAVAKAGTLTTSYWVRCLPPDFPAIQMNAHPDAGAVPPGYYVVGNFFPLPDESPYAIILDVHGVPVWYVKGAPGGIGDVDSVVPGAVSFISYGTHMAPFTLRTLDPVATTPVAPAGALVDGHELQVVPGGGYIVISNPIESGVDLTGITIPGGQTFGPDSSMQTCNLVEFDANGQVTWQWLASEHLDPVKDTTLPALALQGLTAPDGGPLVDPFHCNAIDVNPSNGDLLVSARNMDSVFYVERATGTIRWKMGGSAYTKDGATYVQANDAFYRQHDARMLPGWSSACGGTGELSVFDDESQRDASARGVVYDVTVGGQDGGTTGCPDGGASGGATLVWQYQGAVSSAGTGSFRVTSDGSRVIGWGFGAPDLVFTEVDVDGKDLLDFEFTDGNSSYRAIKVPLSAFDLDVLRDTAGLP